MPLTEPDDTAPQQVRIVVSDGTEGYLETCGCVVNQSGGAARRNGVLAKLRLDHASLIYIDIGDWFGVPDPTDSPRLRASYINLLLDIADIGGCCAIVPDYADCAFGLTEWMRTVAKHSVRPLSSNLTFTGGSASAPRIAKHVIVEAGGMTVAIIGVTSKSWRKRNYDSLVLRAPGTQWRLDDALSSTRRALSRLPQGVDFVIVAGQMSPWVSEALAAELPINLILSSNSGICEPSSFGPRRSKWITEDASFRSGSCSILYVSGLAYGVNVIDVSWDGAAFGAKSSYIELSDESPVCKATRNLIDQFYSSQVSTDDWDRMRPLFPGQGDVGSGYVGSAECSSCHKKIYEQWRLSKHGQAVSSLYRVRRQYAPKCVQCHVVGLGEPTGYTRAMVNQRSDFEDVGCEVCHGGGADHVASPSNKNIIRKCKEGDCRVCHDGKHSPDFSWSAYIEKIRHW